MQGNERSVTPLLRVISSPRRGGRDSDLLYTLFDKPIQPKFRALSVPQPSDSKAQELLGDDVQPFSLDEEFDYDNVALTPKFSEAELKAIIELSEEKTATDVKSAQAED
ncbi:hypothetical protein DUI87_22878 [Hirundo rustica rustica]|uniref:Uncharacterized protein n=1 Tax=Hirundo rustica rustica TaxID=333673 RepID=A0A3M0JIW8_HIRRU|nr:hypothetical protein DUI87_22878 [Hirundo rustica rustica]